MECGAAWVSSRSAHPPHRGRPRACERWNFQTHQTACSLPNKQVVTPQTVGFEAAVLLCQPRTVRLVKLLFALRQRLDLAAILKFGKLLGRHNDRIDATVFFNKNWLNLGLGTDGSKAVFGLHDGHLHGAVLEFGEELV